MRLWLLFLLSVTLWSADIDTRLYDGNDSIGHYEEIAKAIDANETSELNITDATKERMATERMILGKLKDMLSFTPKIDPLPDTLLSADKNVTSENYMQYLDALAKNTADKDALTQEQSNIESKLQYLASNIKNITTEEKMNLRLYQLQYAFYKLKSKNNEMSLKAYDTMLQKGTKGFNTALPRVIFNLGELKRKLAQTSAKLNELKESNVALNLAKEGELMSRETLSRSLSEKYSANIEAIHKIRQNKINETLQLALSYLQKNQTGKMLEVFNSSKTDMKELNKENKAYFGFKKSIVKDLMGEKAGNVSVAISDVGQSVESLYDYSFEQLNKPLFVFNEHGISLMDILKVLLILIAGFIIGAFFKRKMMKFAIGRDRFSFSSMKIISNVGYYLIIFITLIVALKSIGLDLSNLGLIAGALSIGVGFGLQTLVSNLAAGIILMFERTVRIGDFIEISDTVRGTVSDMKMRSTTVTTNDNIDVIIPNSSFIQNNVINWTLENDIRRIHIPFSVAYGTDNAQVEEVILSELKASDLNYVNRAPKYTPSIWMTAMGASSVDYELVIWIRGNSTLKPLGTKSDFLKFIYRILNKHEIEIPFPQMDLHIKERLEKKED